MYQPYLRGKQNEMMALRELIPLISVNQSKISPIIEPVKPSRNFEISLRKLIENNINFTIIVNPQVGKFKSNYNIFAYLSPILNGYTNYQAGIIIENFNNAPIITQHMAANNLTPLGFTIIYNSTDTIHTQDVILFTNFLPIIYNVVNLKKTITDRNFIQNFSSNSRVTLVDYFKSQSKNILYLHNPDSTFSNDFANFINQGNVGFGDYLTVGEDYSETGASPYAVAIHISYLNINTISVKHFTSDTNHDQSDPAGKFFEANQKLVNWCQANGINTLGCNGFIQLQNNQHYPGLGILKKFSIMNHIELNINLI